MIALSGVLLLSHVIAPPPGYAPLDEVVYAIHKPRHVLSAAGEDNSLGRSGRRRQHLTLTDVMLEAGVEPLPGHVGRLDADTTGLILVTSDSLLLRACLNWEDVLSTFGGAPMTKRYELLLAGRHEADSPALRVLGEPCVDANRTQDLGNVTLQRHQLRILMRQAGA